MFIWDYGKNIQYLCLLQQYVILCSFENHCERPDVGVTLLHTTASVLSKISFYRSRWDQHSGGPLFTKLPSWWQPMLPPPHHHLPFMLS